MKRPRKASFLFLFTIFFSTGSALATSFAHVPFPTLVQETQIIARGRIGSSIGKWVESQTGKKIYTYYDFSIDEVIKGDLGGGYVSIRQMGGSVEGVGMDIIGAAPFKRGEDVVVFLGPKNADGSYDLLNLALGKLRVIQNQEGQEELSGLALAGDRRHSHDDETAPQETWTLERLKELVASQSARAETREVVTRDVSSAVKQAFPKFSKKEVRQPATTETEPKRTPFWSVLGAVILFVIALAVLVLRRRKN